MSHTDLWVCDQCGNTSIGNGFHSNQLPKGWWSIQYTDETPDVDAFKHLCSVECIHALTVKALAQKKAKADG